MAHPASWQNQVPPDEAGIMRRLEDIERQMRELGPAIQSAVGPQISGLATAVADLTTAQATLTDLVGTQVKAVAPAAVTQVAISLTESAALYAQLSLTIPTGYTKAAIIAVSSGYLSADTTGLARIAAQIGSSEGHEDTAYCDPSEAATAAHSASLTGLSPGGTLVIATVAYVEDGSITASLTTSALVLFFH